MSFFEYFDAGYALVIALTSIAALTPTSRDDGILNRIKNVFDKLAEVLKRR